MEKTFLVYCTQNGTEPFNEWLTSLDDKESQKRLLVRLRRVAQGNYGDYKRFHGIIELRFHFGKGYRVYCGEDGNTLVVLLTGGDKDSQPGDIKKALEFWEDYNEQKKTENA
jgi:putative addiction module killer protein